MLAVPSVLLHLGHPLLPGSPLLGGLRKVECPAQEILCSWQCACRSTSRLSTFFEIGQSRRELRMTEISYTRVPNSLMAKMEYTTKFSKI